VGSSRLSRIGRQCERSGIAMRPVFFKSKSHMESHEVTRSFRFIAIIAIFRRGIVGWIENCGIRCMWWPVQRNPKATEE